MSLVAIATPWSESELAVMLCALEAHGIPAFVQGAGFGAVHPGPQIAYYNARRIMVSASNAALARDALEIFSQAPELDLARPTTIFRRLRVIFEV